MSKKINNNKKNLENHNKNRTKSIQNKLFDLLVDLDDENAHGYDHNELNLLIKYYIVNKILLDKQCIQIGDSRDAIKIDLTFGKNEDNRIIITGVDKKYIKNGVTICKNISDFGIKDNVKTKINKCYSFNYLSLIKFIQQNHKLNITIVKNKDDSVNLNHYNNINKYNSFKNLSIQHVNNINSRYIRELYCDNNKYLLNIQFKKIHNEYDTNQINDINDDLIGSVSIRRRDDIREQYKNNMININNNRKKDKFIDINSINNYNNDDSDDDIKIKDYIDINKIYDKNINNDNNNINNNKIDLSGNNHKRKRNINDITSDNYWKDTPTPENNNKDNITKQEKRDIQKAKFESFMDLTKPITLDEF